MGRTSTSLPDQPQAAPAGPAFKTTGRWFGAPERPSFGWLSAGVERLAVSGIVLLPPVGYGYWCSHRTLRLLAERLAEQGHTVLRIDYDGTGDAAGDQRDPDRVPAWRDSALAAVAELRRVGCTRIVVVGARLGGTIALLDGRAMEADRIVAWAPLISGRRYVRELRLLSTPVPEDEPLYPPGTVVAQGSIFSAQTLADLGRLEVAELIAPPAPEILLVEGRSTAGEVGVEQLRSLGAEVEHVVVEDGELALATPPEEGDAAGAVIAEICRWVGGAEPGSVEAPRPRTRARLRWGDATIREAAIALHPHRQVGLLTAPIDVDPARATVVFLNPGSETHVGPGRAWVEYARCLALEGYRCARVDFLGWGESPDGGRAPGRPYDAAGEDDAADIVRALAAAGHQRIVLVGLCASAWIALRAVLHAPVAGVIALNPQMYWQPGDPVEIDWDQIRARRADEIRAIDRGARWRLWSVLDALGHRPPAGQWLDDLQATGVPVHLLFAEGDDGLVFLRGRLSRRLARVERADTITVSELPGVDHPMHRTWARPRVVAALSEALAQIESSA